MTCSIKALLGDFLDRELSPSEKKRVESHLGECPGCRAELDELKSLSNVIGGLPQCPLPAGFLDRLDRRRHGAAPARAASWSLPVGARAMAFAAASLLVAVVVYDRVKPAALPIEGMISGAAGNLSSAVPEDQLRLQPPTARHKGISNLEAASPAARSLDTLKKAASLGAKKAKRARAPGAPIGVEDTVAASELDGKAAADQSVTNEQLQTDLVRQQRLMGLQKIVSPDRNPMGQFAAAGAGAEALPVAPPPAAVGGNVAALLKQSASVASTRGAAAEPPPPGASVQGVVVRSEAERAALWASRGLKGDAPNVDYAQGMLVVVMGTSGLAVEIADVKVGIDKTVVQYRQLLLRDPAPTVPYQFRVVLRSDNPVVFQKLP